MSFYTIFKSIDMKAIDGQTPDDYWNTIVQTGIHTMDTVDALQYSIHRNVLIGTESAVVPAPNGYTLTGASAERQMLFVAVVGTCTVTVVHTFSGSAQTDTYSLFGTKKWPCLLEISCANITSATITGAGAATDSNEFVAYWSIEAEPTDVRL